MTSTTLDDGFRPTQPGSKAASTTGTYRAVMQTVRDAGLLRRTHGFYITTLAVLTVAAIGAVTGFVLLGHSWWQLLIAGLLGIILTQFAFVGHEASHRQVFASSTANDRVGRLLANGVVGISYSWWMNKHSRHHANPNHIEKDPDVAPGVLSFTEDAAAEASRIKALLTRHQGYLFFPLLLLEGLNLHVTSIRSLIRQVRDRAHLRELVTVVARVVLYVGVVLWVLPPGLAFAFLGVQLGVFGFYMGASFAPNHKGMPIIPAGAKPDFLSKQVLTSRNITGGRFMSFAMGGLNYQIEHHLFPTMPRPHLPRAREIVREHCQALGIPYTETSLGASYGIVVRYLNRVGLAARDPFDCPTFHQLRGR